MTLAKAIVWTFILSLVFQVFITSSNYLYQKYGNSGEWQQVTESITWKNCSSVYNSKWNVVQITC